REPRRSLGCEVLGAVEAVPVSAPQVLGPTTPSTPMPARDCGFFTARRVAEPKTPSTVSEAPRALSRSCRCETAAPRAPTRSLTELNWDLVGGTALGATPRTVEVAVA